MLQALTELRQVVIFVAKETFNMLSDTDYTAINDINERTVEALSYGTPFIYGNAMESLRDGFRWESSSDLTGDAEDGIGEKVVSVLASYGVKSRLHSVECGPVLVRVNVEPEVGVRVKAIEGLADEVAMCMHAKKVSVVLRSEIGCVAIDMPATERKVVRPGNVNVGVKGMSLPLELGVGVTGNPYAIDLAKAPHMLIAGQTGSGKSVCINSIVMSLLLNVRADRFDFMMVDPKGVELSGYSDLPNLVNGRVLVGAEESVKGLGWLVKEMERRYGVLTRARKRNIGEFNKALDSGEVGKDMMVEDMERMRYVVCIVDEFADLMLNSGKELTEIMMKLAQKSRAVGIHVILATQRPSVDIVTGALKANLPTCIAFKVKSAVDSVTILGCGGAERLLGDGDMLVLTPRGESLERVHGVYYSDAEIGSVTDAVDSYSYKTVVRSVDFESGAENFTAADGSALNACGAMLSSLYDGNAVVRGLVGRAYGVDMGKAWRQFSKVSEAMSA